MGTTISGDTGVVFPDATTQSTAVTVATPFSINASAGAGAQLRLPEATANGVNYVAVKAADALAGNVTWTLPTADGTSGQFLQTNGSGQLAFATPSGVGNSYTEFLASGTWTKPAGVTWIYVEAIGGGGGGRSSAFGGNTCTGGGGGEFTSQLMLASTVGATVSVTVGAGGAGGTVGGADGSAGAASSFGSVVTARGGLGGSALSSNSPGLPGAGGSVASSGLLFPQAGFGGPSNGVGGNTIYGGAGGGGCNGSATRAGGTSTYGGAGGAGGTSGGVGPGAAGSVPGGGGGASGDSVSAAGAGGAGRVRVWAW